MLNKNCKKNRKSGFTLIELIVSVFIISIISGLFLTNYHSGDSKTTLSVYTQLLASDIRSAQNMAMAQSEIDGISTSSWGIYFNTVNPKSYVIFADKNNNLTYNSGGANDETYRTVILPEGIELRNMYLDGVLTNPLDIVFEAPYPDTYLNGSSSTNDVAEIVLRKTGFGTSSVSVNAYGLINASESFKLNILLNSATGLRCDVLCVNAGFAGCTSVGTDDLATNGRRWRKPGPTCNDNPAGCNTNIAVDNDGDMCGGYLAEWTKCLCN